MTDDPLPAPPNLVDRERVGRLLDQPHQFGNDSRACLSFSSSSTADLSRHYRRLVHDLLSSDDAYVREEIELLISHVIGAAVQLRGSKRLSVVAFESLMSERGVEGLIADLGKGHVATWTLNWIRRERLFALAIQLIQRKLAQSGAMARVQGMFNSMALGISHARLDLGRAAYLDALVEYHRLQDHFPELPAAMLCRSLDLAGINPADYGQWLGLTKRSAVYAHELGI